MQLRSSSHASSSCSTSCSTAAVGCHLWHQLPATASRRRSLRCSRAASSGSSSGFQLTTEAISGQLQCCVEGLEAYRWLRGHSMNSAVEKAQIRADYGPADSPPSKLALDDRSIAAKKARTKELWAENSRREAAGERPDLPVELMLGLFQKTRIVKTSRDAGFSLRATSALAPAATILVTTPIASLPPSAADPGPSLPEAAYALKKAGATVTLHEDAEGQQLLQYDKQEDEHAPAEEEEEREEEDKNSLGAWWEKDQWYSYLKVEKDIEFWGSLEKLTGEEPVSWVAVAALAWQLRTKSLSGNARAKVWGLHMHDGEHWEQQPRLQAANCPFPPDLAGLATDAPPLPGAAHLAAIITYTQERDVQLYGAEDAKDHEAKHVEEAQYALQRCRNPADRWRALPFENSVVGENAFVLQQDPWLAELAAQQQQQQQNQSLPAVVQGVWPELGMIPHSCAPNTTAAVMHKSAVLLNAGSHGIPEGAPLTRNLLGRDSFLPIQLRRAAVKKLGGVMAYGDCSCERCRLEGGLPAELQQQMMEVQLFCKSIGSAAHPAEGSTDSSGGTSLQQQRQQLAAHLQAVEDALAELQLGQQQQLWLQASVLNLHELAAEAAAAAGEEPPLPVLETLVAAAAEAAPGSATHLHWAQQYAAAAAAAIPHSSSIEAAATTTAEAEQQRLAAYQLRYGSSLSTELYALLAAQPVAKPVRQLAGAAWWWGRNYRPSTGEDDERLRVANADDKKVYKQYYGNDGLEGCSGADLERRMHVEL